MKQKMVIKLQMDCDKCRNKALKTAAEVHGVTSVSLEGDAKDSVAVIGDDVDTICLANQLKKKFRNVIIVSVEKVKSAEEKKKDEEKKKEEEKKKKEEDLKKCRELLCHPPSSCKDKCDTCSKCVGKPCDPTKCDGKHCNPSKCECTKCDGHCVTICIKCKEPKCHGQCKPCPNCQNNECDGCKPKPKPPSPNPRQCPPWCTCSKCYVPYPSPCYNPYPPNCTVVYDPSPDPCSIM